MAFCERCAREQETYFAIGELTEAGGGRAGGESLAMAIDLTKKSTTETSGPGLMKLADTSAATSSVRSGV